ncbi:MAG: type II toxin-antitoxin system HicB family antitoxin [Gammaproteobacteria bacterium]|nr:type II toxin-antitoxin system HicB family antitoxin [Gammaproteobacteria bacterium]
MKNLMQFGDFRAVISYDPEIESFRGEFIGLNGGADFYADNAADLKREGELSLRAFLDACERHSIPPKKQYSGKFNLRVSSELHSQIADLAAANGDSLNKWIEQALETAIRQAS